MSTTYSKRKRYPYIRRKRRSRLRLLLLFLLILAVIYLVGIISGGLGKEREKTRLKTYILETNKIVVQSNAIARDFNRLKADAPKISRSELGKKLTNQATRSGSLAKESRKIEVPSKLKKAHSYLMICLDLRAKGLKDYKPALFSALKDIDLEVSSGQVALALMDLRLSDRAYSLFRKEVEGVLKDMHVPVSVIDSKFLKESMAFQKESIIAYLRELKGVEALEEIHGVGIIELKIEPKQASYVVSRRLAILPRSNQLSATVTVENQGNQPEKNIPVEAILKSETEPREYKWQAKISSMAPGEKKTIVFSGLKPITFNVVHLLTIKVGSVPNEKNTANNIREFKFMMR
ncbi:MAG: hypothetical protein AB1466_00865 [Actinomycetota bacterium]